MQEVSNTRSHEDQGVERFCTFKEYQERYGEEAARAMRARKKELERKRDPALTELPFWKKNPDVDTEDMELFRVFDSHTVTRRNVQSQSETLTAAVELDGDQTRDFLLLSCTYLIPAAEMLAI